MTWIFENLVCAHPLGQMTFSNIYNKDVYNREIYMVQTPHSHLKMYQKSIWWINSRIYFFEQDVYIRAIWAISIIVV